VLSLPQLDLLTSTTSADSAEDAGASGKPGAMARLAVPPFTVVQKELEQLHEPVPGMCGVVCMWVGWVLKPVGCVGGCGCS
jgi:hypothetical protein